MHRLYDIVKEGETLIGGKGDYPSGTFKKWLDSPEGQKALSRGISVEMEHTNKRSIAREIATDHLKEDRKYYEKLAKVGLDEALYDNPDDARRDMTDDLIDPFDTVSTDDEPVDIEAAFKAIRNPAVAKKQGNDPKSRGILIRSLQQIASTASHLLQSMQPAVAAEAVSMGVGSMGVRGGPEGDAPGAGTGVPVLNNQRKKKKPQPLDKNILRPNQPANSSMVGTDPMVPGRSAFAKGVE